eukprot:479443-Rhodomonas_salina.1
MCIRDRLRIRYKATSSTKLSGVEVIALQSLVLCTKLSTTTRSITSTSSTSAGDQVLQLRGLVLISVPSADGKEYQCRVTLTELEKTTSNSVLVA